jgi:hypothetical protein
MKKKRRRGSRDGPRWNRKAGFHGARGRGRIAERPRTEDGPVKYATHFTGERGLMADEEASRGEAAERRLGSITGGPGGVARRLHRRATPTLLEWRRSRDKGRGGPVGTTAFPGARWGARP